jgi:hypothetical protein
MSYILRSQFATARGSNRTQLAILKQGSRLALAKLVDANTRYCEQFGEFASRESVTDTLDLIG